jgi:hypothetical protein
MRCWQATASTHSRVVKAFRETTRSRGLLVRFPVFAVGLNLLAPQRKDVFMPWPKKLCALFLIAGLSVSTAVRAQSQVDEIGPLSTALSTEQLQSSLQLSPAAVPQTTQPRARSRLSKPVVPLSSEAMSYRSAVQKLGVDTHRFVRCELPNGKVRTGVITAIRDDGFTLKDGIIIDQRISYADLKAAPRPVAAVGTRVGHVFKWAGFVIFFPVIVVAIMVD